MNEQPSDSRRSDDERFAEFMGEFREWKESSIRWRTGVEKRLDTLAEIISKLPPERISEILEFMDEIRTPRKLVLWSVRAFFVATIGGVAAAIVAFIKERILR